MTSHCHGGIQYRRESNFHALVSIMDEMAINDVKHYAMVDPELVEYKLMSKK
jgi:hypothetical protein